MEIFSIILTAISTFLLTVFTVLLVQETSKSRKDNFLPIIVIVFFSDGIILKNIGKGLANKIQIRQKISDPPSLPRSLAPDGSSYKIENKYLKLNELEFVYRDVFNRECVTKVYLWQQEFEFVPPVLQIKLEWK